MELTLFALLFVIGFITYLLSLKIDEKDLTNTYQVQLSFLSIVIFTILMFASFNIEVIHIADNGTITTDSIVDYGYIAASTGLFLMNLLNLVVLMFWGSYTVLFNRR